ncbi:MAG TPA: 2-oxoacid:acceptor oxidoreductase family protein [Candidatus Lokiarchaeia archaeon]|nr:2-oxoacid:acceptor oxidoreductase family protein [Candidatus Lokiarchaeia archaeon]
MDNEKLYEITVLSRGGQGGILGNKLLGKVAFADGFKDIMAIPIIGAERRGAPIKAYLRISNQTIRRIDAITNPDYILVLDESLLNYPAIFSTIVNTKVIINTEYGQKYAFPETVTAFEVPATRIAIELNLLVAGQPVVNVAMIGAFAKASGLITIESIRAVLEEAFGKKAEINFQAAKEAYDQTIEVGSSGQ